MRIRRRRQLKALASIVAPDALVVWKEQLVSLEQDSWLRSEAAIHGNPNLSPAEYEYLRFYVNQEIDNTLNKGEF